MEKVRGMYFKVWENGGAYIVICNGDSGFEFFILSHIYKNLKSLDE